MVLIQGKPHDVREAVLSGLHKTNDKIIVLDDLCKLCEPFRVISYHLKFREGKL